MATTLIFTNARIFSGRLDQVGVDHGCDCMIIEGERILHVGTESDTVVEGARQGGGEVVDLRGSVLIPAFIDSHCHFLSFGQSLKKLDLTKCTNLEEIRRYIVEYAVAHPTMPRLLCRGWQQVSTNGKGLANMIDDLDDRPIYIESLDLHSTWCNSPALKEVDAEAALIKYPNDVEIDKDGRPSGLLSESVQTGFIWPFLNGASSSSEISDALDAAVHAYTSAGYAGFIDMAMDELNWNALEKHRQEGRLPFHVAAHWLVPFDEDEEFVHQHLEEAIDKHNKYNPCSSPQFCVVGIKIINDGTVDGCTASLSRPYGRGDSTIEPFWPAETLSRVVRRATEAGLQVAIHAIGDRAVKEAIDAIEHAKSPLARHRVEHLEVTSEQDAARLGRLGITASVQPVHSDPDILRVYPQLIGPEFWKRAFAYGEFAAHDAPIAIGTDAPTARHYAIPNLYNATERKSATEPSMPERTQPQNAITLSQALTAATAGAAYSRFAEQWTGSLAPGLQADFVVLDSSWSSESLLDTRVLQTWHKGKKAFSMI